MLNKKNDYLKMPRVLQLKIFLFKMGKVFKEVNKSIWYLPDIKMQNGLFGTSQLFTIEGEKYLYSPNPYGYTIKRVLGIYKKGYYTFLILERKDGFYEVQKDNFIHHHLFKSFDECKKYIEDF